MRVQAAPREHAHWLCERIAHTPSTDFKAIEAIDANGTIRGMVGYDNWTGNAVRMHLAMSGPAVLRALLRPAFEYPFRQCLRGLVLAYVPAHSARSTALVLRLGFRETYRIHDGCARGDDLVLFEMRTADCRWLSFDSRKAA